MQSTKHFASPIVGAKKKTSPPKITATTTGFAGMRANPTDNGARKAPESVALTTMRVRDMLEESSRGQFTSATYCMFYKFIFEMLLLAELAE